MTKLAQLNIDIRDEAAGKLPGVTAENAAQDQGWAGMNSLISRGLSVAIALAAILVFFYLIWGAIEWITSGGDKGKAEKAREKMTGAVIGLIVLASTIAIFTLIQNFLGISVLQFSSRSNSTQTTSCSQYQTAEACTVTGCQWANNNCVPCHNNICDGSG